jgi:hypothetical protein
VAAEEGGCLPPAALRATPPEDIFEQMMKRFSSFGASLFCVSVKWRAGMSHIFQTMLT